MAKEATEKKTAAEKKESTVKAATETTAKKTTAKKTAAATAKKTIAAAEKKTTTRKSTAKKTVTNTEVYVQFWGKEVYAKDIVENIRKIWTEEMGKKEAELTDLKVYIKPEDNGAHYVINGEITGFVSL